MKKHLLIAVVSAIILCSCASSYYYQVCTVTPLQEKVEDSNCKIVNNFWGEGGDGDFWFYNETDSFIVIDKNQSFFITNRMAKPLFKNGTVTRSSSSAVVSRTGSEFASAYGNASALTAGDWTFGSSSVSGSLFSYSTTTTGSSSSSYSTSEKGVIIVPPKCFVLVDNYSILRSIIRDCDLLINPKQTISKEFTKDATPLFFENWVTYYIGDKKHEIRSTFYISAVSNMRAENFVEYKTVKSCGETIYGVRINYNTAPNKFYNSYFSQDLKTYISPDFQVVRNDSFGRETRSK